MASKKTAASAKAVRAEHGDRFFERELSSEEPPALATMRELYLASVEFFALEPWRALSDSQLIAVNDPSSGQSGYCCVMGALGEIFSLHVFLGIEGYRVFDAIQSQDPNVVDWMYGSAGSVSTEMVPRSELKPQDRDLLRALGHPTKPGQLVPIFRAQRKGYLAWFVTEAEAKFLNFCVKAAKAMVVHLSQNPGARYWNRKKHLPMMTPKTADGEFAIEAILIPDLSKAAIQMPAWDRDRVNAIRVAAFPREGVFEVDHFYTPASFGEKHERKACLGMSLVVDSQTAAVLKPEISKPGESASNSIAQVLLNVIESLRNIPKEVHVRDRNTKAAMSPLALELGFQLKAASSMPAFDFAKQQLTQMLGH